MGYTNSSLVSYTKLSPNHSGLRTHTIDRISPHCVVGQCAIETLGNVFADRNKEASSNYGIGYDGRIGMFVEEKNRSWCTSSNSNDQRAVTIECASDTTEPYTMNSAVYESLVRLCTDICKRNGKTKLLWFADKDKTLNYTPKPDEMVLTVHRWFANKSCPGDWLYARLGYLAKKVTANLGTSQNNKQTLGTQSNTKIFKGIDLSYANGNVDFSKIDKSQVQFAILRSSYGWEANQKDDQFERNYNGFKKLNIPIGVYHYSYARNANEGVKEAEYCLSCIKGKKFELPIYLDMEDNSVTSAGKNNLTNAALAFCQRIEKAGYKAGIYSSPCYIDDYIDINKIQMAGYSFWLAEWHDGSPSMSCDIWQHKVGSAGTIKGVSGEIDMNYLYNTSIFTTTSTTNNSDNKTNNSNKNEVSQINSSSTVNYSVKVTSKNGVNIRNGAGTGYKILGAVPYNTTLKVTKQTSGGGYTWGLVTYNGITGWIALNYTKKIKNTITFKKGDKVKVKNGAVVYGTNQTLSSFVYKTTYQIIEISGNRVVIGINGQVTTAVEKKYLIKV